MYIAIRIKRRRLWIKTPQNVAPTANIVWNIRVVTDMATLTICARLMDISCTVSTKTSQKLSISLPAAGNSNAGMKGRKSNMIGSSTICGIIIGLIVIVLFGLIFHTMYDDMTINHWIPQTIIAGIIITSLTICAGIIDDNDTKVEKSIKNTITANYDNVLNYHNEDDNKTFVSGDSKYTFDYDKETETLIVLKGSNVDAIFVDGVKQKGEKQYDRNLYNN